MFKKCTQFTLKVLKLFLYSYCYVFLFIFDQNWAIKAGYVLFVSQESSPTLTLISSKVSILQTKLASFIVIAWPVKQIISCVIFVFVFYLYLCIGFLCVYLFLGIMLHERSRDSLSSLFVLYLYIWCLFIIVREIKHFSM